MTRTILTRLLAGLTLVAATGVATLTGATPAQAAWCGVIEGDVVVDPPVLSASGYYTCSNGADGSAYYRFERLNYDSTWITVGTPGYHASYTCVGSADNAYRIWQRTPSGWWVGGVYHIACG
ncbi:hypothetical protein Lfu02_71970 [Longispora fulva]|uniref:Secreted protein n=1 Tax=Longispora fulva TaxID=619741 RepID=A0A8J7GXV9_9ACTN|nr:hypothetical protein [Longispora fulva]MBG6141179.1 hypothetical protein [Longispora fulva]GIG62825.1 hypothetical protein Lfu02_71970 [Longispora fulva]